MENKLDSLISLLKKTMGTKDHREITSLEKEISDLVSHINTSQIDTKSEEFSGKISELEIIISQMIENQEKRIKLFEQFKSFLEKKKI